MPVKHFEQVIRFIQCPGPGRTSIWLPIVNVSLITVTNNSIFLSLLFDTGASVTTLPADFYFVFGVQSWDQGQRINIATAGGPSIAYQYSATLEIFGKTINNCPIHLTQMSPNPIYSGLLGRETVFNEFGFGFWESVKELYVTNSP